MAQASGTLKKLNEAYDKDMDYPAKEKLLLQDIILNRDKHIECVRTIIEAAFQESEDN